MQRDDGKNNDSTAVRDGEQLPVGQDHKLQPYDEEVDKLIEWLRDMPHLPNVNGEYGARNRFGRYQCPILVFTRRNSGWQLFRYFQITHISIGGNDIIS